MHVAHVKFNIKSFFLNKITIIQKNIDQFKSNQVFVLKLHLLLIKIIKQKLDPSIQILQSISLQVFNSKNIILKLLILWVF